MAVSTLERSIRTTEEKAAIERFFANLRKAVSGADIGAKVIIDCPTFIDHIGLFAYLRNGLGIAARDIKQNGNEFSFPIGEIAKRIAAYNEQKAQKRDESAGAVEWLRDCVRPMLRELERGDYYAFELPDGVDVRGFCCYVVRGGCKVIGADGAEWPNEEGKLPSPKLDENADSNTFGKMVFEVELA